MVEGVGEGRVHIDEEKEADMCDYVFYIDTEEIESKRNLRKCFPEVTLPSLLRS